MDKCSVFYARAQSLYDLQINSFICRLRSIINSLPRDKEVDAYVWLCLAEGPTMHRHAMAFHESSICSKELGKISGIVRYLVNWEKTTDVSLFAKKLQTQ